MYTGKIQIIVSTSAGPFPGDHIIATNSDTHHRPVADQ